MGVKRKMNTFEVKNPIETHPVEMPVDSPDDTARVIINPVAEDAHRSEKKEDEEPTLKRVRMTENELKRIKENLNHIIDAMEHNPSFLSRASAFWGERSLWQKIVAGVVLIVPTFVIAIVAQIAVLFVISIITLIVYTASSILLDNHYNSNFDRTNHLKKGINGLADTLGMVIQSLERLHELLGVEIKRFHEENTKLKEHVSELYKQVGLLTEQGEEFKKIEQAWRQTQTNFEEQIESFRQTRIDLEERIESLSAVAQERLELLKSTQERLNQTSINYEQLQIELAQKITEFQRIKGDLELEIDKGKKITATLHATVIQLSEGLQLDSDQHKAFLDKLTEFVNNKEQSFHLLTERIFESERELERVKEELKRCNERYQGLLQRGEEQLDRLETLSASSPSVSLVISQGFYSGTSTAKPKRTGVPPAIEFGATQAACM